MLIPDPVHHTPRRHFVPTRPAALTALQGFLPHAGRDYATLRNYDLPQDGHPHVSGLSPYLRHRLITEQEVVEAVLARHSPQAAEKFLQEVFWRSYWKGWLEMRPEVWGDYIRGRDRAIARLEADPALRDAVARAEAGETDIEAFNDWITELTQTGYLHNHARMWVASIWIFTLGLPWEIGADLFLRHLLDGDPASNTLGWRWVAGVQTQGKHYVARASNISKYTRGRHNPGYRLNTAATPLAGSAHPALRPLRDCDAPEHGARSAVLLTEDDLSPGFLAKDVPDSISIAGLLSTAARSSRPVPAGVSTFARSAMEDALSRWAGRFGEAGPITDAPSDICEWAVAFGVEQIVTPYAPVGPAASRLRVLERSLRTEGIRLVQVRRRWDEVTWPHATHGFFRFKKEIPGFLEGLG